jgi:hypothetical protein
VSRLRAGRTVGTVSDEQQWELVFAWGGQHRRDVIHSGGRCDGIPCWSKFDSDEDRAAAWFVLRDELINLPNLGFRPAGYWAYESESLCRHEPRCPKWPRDELGWLRDHGQLTPRERRIAG